MRTFPGLRWGVSTPVQGVRGFHALGSLHMTPEDRDVISQSEDIADLSRSVELRAGDLDMFLVVWHALRQLVRLSGEPTYLIGSSPSTFPEEPGPAGFGEVLRRSVFACPMAEAKSKFWVGVRDEGSPAFEASGVPEFTLIRPPFERSRELAAAMVSDAYWFDSVAAFCRAHQDLASIARELERARDPREFLESLLVAFPTLFIVDREGLFDLTSRDDEVLRALDRERAEARGGSRPQGPPP